MEHTVDEIPVAIDSHPEKNLFAIGCIDGHVKLMSFESIEKYHDVDAPLIKKCKPSTSSNAISKLSGDFSYPVTIETKWSQKHKASVRNVLFSPAGEKLYSVTRNRTISIFDVETGEKLRVIRGVTPKNIRPYSACIVSEHQLALGDECGALNVFDWRSQEPIPLASRITSEDDIDDDTSASQARYVTGILAPDQSRSKGLLLATRGDGCLVAADMRKKKILVESEPMHDELLCLTVMNSGKRLMCGSADGHVEVFNFGEWGNLIERLDTGHTDTLDCMCTLETRQDQDNSSLLVTGSSDGTLRLFHTLPNRKLGLVGGKSGGAPIEALTVCQNALISCDQDSLLKFYDVKKINDFAPKTKSGSEMKKMLKRKPKSEKSAFFSDLAERLVDEPSDDGQDSETGEDEDGGNSSSEDTSVISD